jgi:hypothetical protein
METEENKYYIPEIEEFHVGFECEFYNSKDKHFYFEAPDGWIKTMIGENLYLREFTNQYQLLKENLFRVKYLNKEDIESCLSNLLDFKIINFEDDNFIEYEFSKGGMEYSGLYTISDRIFSVYENDECLFRGEIKNKSELKILMKQLGI